jgi:hypothetical protein
MSNNGDGVDQKERNEQQCRGGYHGSLSNWR